MSEWLKLLPLELSEMGQSDIIEPPHPMLDSDRPVGDMSDMSKRLFTLGHLLDKAGSQSKLNAKFCTDKVERIELFSRTNEYLAKAEIIRALMWIGIKDEFGLWNDSVGVRVGFKVVTIPESESNMPPFLKRLLGLE